MTIIVTKQKRKKKKEKRTHSANHAIVTTVN